MFRISAKLNLTCFDIAARRSTLLLVALAHHLLAKADPRHGVGSPVVGSHVAADLFIYQTPDDKRRFEPCLCGLGTQKLDGGPHRFKAGTEQAGQTDDIRFDFQYLGQKGLGGNIHTYVENRKPVTLQQYLDYILTDIVDIALHRAEEYRA
jgi:hypothetical protein